ncbi:DUF3360 family protein [Vibrio lentus]|nr:DUF3360 family protein [Vibrio lentus]
MNIDDTMTTASIRQRSALCSVVLTLRLHGVHIVPAAIAKRPIYRLSRYSLALFCIIAAVWGYPDGSNYLATCALWLALIVGVFVPFARSWNGS